MKLRHCFRKRVAVPFFALLTIFVATLLSFTIPAGGQQGVDWDGCGCPYPGVSGPQEHKYVGEINCNRVNFQWCRNCEIDIAGYEMEYKIVPQEPVDGVIIGPDSIANPWNGTGLDQGDSPIRVWIDGRRPQGADGTILADPFRPEMTLSGLQEGQYYVFALRAIDQGGRRSGHSDENSGYVVCRAGVGDLKVKSYIMIKTSW